MIYSCGTIHDFPHYQCCLAATSYWVSEGLCRRLTPRAAHVQLAGHYHYPEIDIAAGKVFIRYGRGWFEQVEGEAVRPSTREHQTKHGYGCSVAGGEQRLPARLPLLLSPPGRGPVFRFPDRIAQCFTATHGGQYASILAAQ